MSSCVSFTTGPIFAGLLAFILIKEKLSLSEVVAILFGIVGTTMLTMP
jgi:drug/metabolite transporter (DMT)-like permease